VAAQHQLGHVKICTLLQTDSHASTPPLGFLHAVSSSCRPTNSIKGLQATVFKKDHCIVLLLHLYYLLLLLLSKVS